MINNSKLRVFTFTALSALVLAGCSATEADIQTQESEDITSAIIGDKSSEIPESLPVVESESEVETTESSLSEEVEEVPVVEAPSSHSQIPDHIFESIEVPDSSMYVVVNDNVPFFSNEDISSTEAWEMYGDLDYLNRVTEANALLGVELMPAEERGSISSVYPTGWNQEKYDIVSGGWLYNRSHMIGFQLTGENANWKNLMTGTRSFNVDGMLPFENTVADYIERTENHVRYRITPHFKGENLLAHGVFMEAFSIEDNGDGVMFNVYVPNKQTGVNIDYSNGKSWVDGHVAEEKVETPVVETPADNGGNVHYKNCTAAREAGAAPVRAGDPGYGKHLDRDGDGVGCE